jgi:hypothetical protein
MRATDEEFIMHASTLALAGLGAQRGGADQIATMAEERARHLALLLDARDERDPAIALAAILALGGLGALRDRPEQIATMAHDRARALALRVKLTLVPRSPKADTPPPPVAEEAKPPAVTKSKRG